MLKLRVSDFIQALDKVGVVAPKPLTPTSPHGYLCVVSAGEGRIYTRDAKHCAVVNLPVVEVESDISFVFPTESVDSLRYLKDEFLYLESMDDVNNCSVTWSTDSGSSATKSTFPAGMIADCQAALLSAKEVKSYPVALLKEAINAVRPFMAKDAKTAREQDLTMQIFDSSNPTWEKINGFCMATDARKSAIFYAKELEDGFLSVHAQSVGPILAFLAKSEGEIKCKVSDHIIFLENWDGDVIGWTKHLKTHEKLKNPPDSADPWVLDLPKESLLNAIKFVRAETQREEDRMVLSVSGWVSGDGTDPELIATKATVEFIGSTARGKSKSYPLVAAVTRCRGKFVPIAWGVSISNFLALIEGSKSDVISLRFLLKPDDSKSGVVRVDSKSGVIRVVEDYRIDQSGKIVDQSKTGTGIYQCKITRAMYSLI